MKVLYKNKTKYTLDVYDKYLQFHRKKFGFRYNLYTIIFSILILFCLIINLVYGQIFLALIFTVILACFIWYRMFFQNKKAEKEAKTDKFKNEKEYEFVFYNDKLVIYDGKKHQNVKYWHLYRIYQTKNYFYLYIDKERAFLLNKNNFTVGKPSNFFKFIKKKTWYRFLRFK